MIIGPPRTSQDADPQAALAAELAAKLLPVEEILERYSKTPAQLKQLMADKQFRHMVAEFRREWNSPLSARDRVKVKSALAVEDGILELNRLFYDPDVTPNVRLDAYKQLVQLADMQPKRDDAGPATGGFSISINIPQPEGAPRQMTLEHSGDPYDE
jgi:hypothetical protein